VDIRTHQSIDRELCGNPVAVSDGSCRVALQTTRQMAVDETGLVHGGFIFSLADHAAMVAVNHPYVVLGGADVRFVRPVAAGALAVAEARVGQTDGRKRLVDTTVTVAGEVVFEGRMTCFVLDQHVLHQPADR
jgi:uncharacterized protein (TIGR00369 family)